MELFYLTLSLYFALNVVLTIGTLWAGIVVKGDRVAPRTLAFMVTVLALFGLPIAVMVYNKER